MDTLEQLKYPVGRYEKPVNYTEAQRDEWIKNIQELPTKLRHAVAGLSDEQLDTPYREEGWTVRQVVHHVADSHMNAFIRLKLTLTEDKPVIKPYKEDRFARLADTVDAPIALSLTILDALHSRWMLTLNALHDDDFHRIYIHPEYGKEFTIEESIALYSWHSRHHVAHITSLKDRMGW